MKKIFYFCIVKFQMWHEAAAIGAAFFVTELFSKKILSVSRYVAAVMPTGLSHLEPDSALYAHFY